MEINIVFLILLLPLQEADKVNANVIKFSGQQLALIIMTYHRRSIFPHPVFLDADKLKPFNCLNQ